MDLFRRKHCRRKRIKKWGFFFKIFIFYFYSRLKKNRLEGRFLHLFFYVKSKVRNKVESTNLRKVMLTSVLRALVKNPIKESFYEKRKKNN